MYVEQIAENNMAAVLPNPMPYSVPGRGFIKKEMAREKEESR